jgi:hypothetical protein
MRSVSTLKTFGARGQQSIAAACAKHLKGFHRKGEVAQRASGFLREPLMPPVRLF